MRDLYVLDESKDLSQGVRLMVTLRGLEPLSAYDVRLDVAGKRSPATRRRPAEC